ncbi:MAG TPA: hypothetical protein VK668_08165 [Mucilaginibacter sp.]|nr:hypothetical protein [Mucilaginibacter sp.]
MKNSLIRSILFISLGIALFTLSMVTKNTFTEKWSSFALGLSFPLFVAGIIALAFHINQLRQQN